MTNSETLTKEDIDKIVARLKGTVFYKWKTVLDNHTCVECLLRNGKIFHIKEIERAHIRPPHHINCRCTLVPYEDFT